MKPLHSWKKPLDEPLPSSSVHNYSTPPIVEALSLLPLAYRVSSYIAAEKKAGRGTVFDLNGATLHPPHPGPFGGCPIGGIGAGSIGRGFRGDFRRWSLTPGKYVHQTVDADQFSMRVRRGGQINSVVLSIIKADRSSGLSSWSFGKISPSTVVYESVFPRAWTVIDNALPDFKVTIRQVSPFLPHSYSETSFPVGLFHIDVENSGSDDADVSIMFSFQNGGVTGVDGSKGQKCHSHFQQSYPNSQLIEIYDDVVNGMPTMDDARSTNILGVCMATLETESESRHRTRSRSRSRATSGASVTSAMNEDRVGCSISCVASDEGGLYIRSESAGATTATETDRSSICMSEVNTAEGISSGIPGCQVTCAFSIAAKCSSDGDGDRADGILSHCVQFVIGSHNERRWGHALFGSHSDSHSTYPATAEALWQRFHLTGDLTPIPIVFETQPDSTPHPAVPTSTSGRFSNSKASSGSRNSESASNNYLHSVAADGVTTGSAVCLRKTVLAKCHETFSFSVAWDIPTAKFGGSRKQLPKYYTRFWGRSKLSAHGLAAYALLRADAWERRICDWQTEILRNAELAAQLATEAAESPAAGASASKTSSSRTSSSKAESVGVPDYYKHMIFNELYFLVDGGTIWTDSCSGEPNEVDSPGHTDTNGTTTVPPIGDYCDPGLHLYQQLNCTGVHASLNIHFLLALARRCRLHDAELQNSNGDQRQVGQFLYLEGHEYLMYNTYDVHFYASFALLQVFPQLELSVQRDFAVAVAKEDHTQRKMLANGNLRPRKVKGAVPHDLGSPFENPWHKLNSYNLQDVSRWKDLGPKFVLQIYRDFQYISSLQVAHDRKLAASQGMADGASDRSKVLYKPSANKSNKTLEAFLSTKSAHSFLAAVFPAVISAMESTHDYDKDGDGMIENEGYPDQTYDIWTAEGIHAYCGGLWIAANEAAAEMSYIMGVFDRAEKFKLTASRGRVAYMEALWNGSYLNYDSSSSSHSSSIMADMLAGHWYARVCALPGVVPSNMALSCFETIFANNVQRFGGGELMGAVNGMRPNGSIDSTCMQSREVWTGTTYALAAGMLQEAVQLTVSPSLESSVDEDLTSNFDDVRSTSGTLSAAAASLATSAPISISQPKVADMSSSSPCIASSPIDSVETRRPKGSVSFDDTEVYSKIDAEAQAVVSSSNGTDEKMSVSQSLTYQQIPGPVSGQGVPASHPHGADTTRSSQTSKPNSRLNSKDSSRRNSDCLPVPQPTMSRGKLSLTLWRQAFSTAQGIHDAGWKKFGYWFATPEAWEKSGNYRSLGYMRPLSIWAMQFALDKWSANKPMK